MADIGVPVLMTLAGIAYGQPDKIANYLAEATLTADWELAWLPSPPDPPVNFAFLARHRGSGAYVLSIRGTYPNPFSPAYWADGEQDSPFGEMVDWPGASGARISAGTSEGLTNLLALTDSAGTSLPAAIAAQGTAEITVTGHSLGGTLAPVLALRLAETNTQAKLYATSFAGMTPGNGAFAALFEEGTKLAGRVIRVFNKIDSVPYGWDKVWATHDFFDPAPKGGLAVSAMLLATCARLELGGYKYAAIGDPLPLQGVVRRIAIDCTLVAYVIETLYQHMPDTYLALLGAPPLPFSIIFAGVVLPSTHPAANAPMVPRPPVVYVS